jgi:hypothetical protein
MLTLSITISIILLAGVIILGLCVNQRCEKIDELRMELRSVRVEKDMMKERHEACANAFLIDVSKPRAIPLSDVEDKIVQLRIRRDRHHDECIEWRNLWHDKVLPALEFDNRCEVPRESVILQMKILMTRVKDARAREKELLRLPKGIAAENAKLSEEVDSLRYQIHEITRSHRFSSEIVFALEKLGFSEEFGWDGIPRDVERLMEHCGIMEARVLELERQLAAAVKRDSVTGRYVKTPPAA